MPDERRKTKKEKAKAAAGGSLSLTTVAAVFSAIVAAVAVAFAFFLRQASASGGPAELALAPNSFSSTECHEDHYTPRVEDCSPRQCGKVVLDDFASPEETAALLAIAKRGMSMGGGAGGPTIMDMASGALSYEDKFIDVWLAFNLTGRPPFSRSDLAPFKAVTERVAKAVGEHFVRRHPSALTPPRRSPQPPAPSGPPRPTPSRHRPPSTHSNHAHSRGSARRTRKSSPLPYGGCRYPSPHRVLPSGGGLERLP